MEWMKTWGTCVCCTAVACAVLQFLAPDNSTGRVLELIGTALLVCGMLSPLVTVDWKAMPESFSLLTSEGQETLLQEQILQQLSGPLQTAVSERGGEILATYGLKAKKIEAVMDTDEHGRIYITKIVATLTPEQALRRLAVQQILTERFGVKTEVIEEES